jgi:hypothetical protein
MACLHGRLAARLQCLVCRHRAHVSWRPPQPGARAASAAAVRRCQPGAAGGRHWRPRRAATGPARAVELEAPQLAPAHPLVGERMSWEGRSAACGDLRPEREGDALAVCGWVHRQRNLGGVCFVDVRDSSGLLQARAPGRRGAACAAQVAAPVTKRQRARSGHLQPAPPAPLRHGLRSRLRRGVKRAPGRDPAALSSLSGRQGPAGAAQVVSSPGEFPAAARALERVRAEYVVRVAGTLRRRKDPNPQLPTGAVELLAEQARLPAQRSPGCAPSRMHGRGRARPCRTAIACAPCGRLPARRSLRALHAWPLPACVDSRAETPTARWCRRGLGRRSLAASAVGRPFLSAPQAARRVRVGLTQHGWRAGDGAERGQRGAALPARGHGRARQRGGPPAPPHPGPAVSRSRARARASRAAAALACMRTCAPGSALRLCMERRACGLRDCRWRPKACEHPQTYSTDKCYYSKLPYNAIQRAFTVHLLAYQKPMTGGRGTISTPL